MESLRRGQPDYKMLLLLFQKRRKWQILNLLHQIRSLSSGPCLLLWVSFSKDSVYNLQFCAYWSRFRRLRVDLFDVKHQSWDSCDFGSHLFLGGKRGNGYFLLVLSERLLVVQGQDTGTINQQNILLVAVCISFYLANGRCGYIVKARSDNNHEQ